MELIKLKKSPISTKIRHIEDVIKKVEKPEEEPKHQDGKESVAASELVAASKLVVVDVAVASVSDSAFFSPTAEKERYIFVSARKFLIFPPLGFRYHSSRDEERKKK